MFDGGSPLVAEVFEQDVAEFAARAAAQRVQDSLVLTHRFVTTIGHDPEHFAQLTIAWFTYP